MQTLNTRICLKRDNYNNWKTVDETFIPLSGEPCVVIVAAASNAVVQEPAVLLKIGDGATTLKNLPFVSGLAADVYDWAKAAVKPTYTAEEISGLENYISSKIQNTDTQYKIEQDATDSHILKLYSKSLDGEWTESASVTTADTVYDDTALAEKVAALETLVGSDTVSTQIAAAITALNLAETYAKKSDIDALTTTINGVKTTADNNAAVIEALNGSGEGSIAKRVSDAVAAIVADAPESYDTLKEISDWITSHGESAAAMNTQITENKTSINNLIKLIGTLPEGITAATVIGYIAEAVNAEIGKLKIPAGKLADKDTVAESDFDDALKTKLNSKANDADMAAVAKSGNINDLIQSDGDYIIFNCGTASTVI